MPTLVPLRRARTALIIAAALPALTCSDALGPATRALEAAEARWADAGYTTYAFTTSRECECPANTIGPMRISVTNGDVTAVTELSSGDPLDPNEWFTINDLFSLIHIELERLPSKLEVTYDPVLGFPSEVAYGNREVDAGAVISVYDVTDSSPGRGRTR